MFNKHRTEQQAALSLIHRHFDLEPSERLVEYGRVTAPWVLDPALEKSVHPKSWRFIGDTMYPYEFEFDPYNKSDHGAPQPFDLGFLNDLQDILKEHELLDTFGVALAPPENKKEPCLVEFTAGRTNVLRPFDEDEAEYLGVEALWTFSCVWNPLTDGDGKPQMRMCRVKCPFCIC